jgi:Zn-dependent protease/CBS domain-containing protein
MFGARLRVFRLLGIPIFLDFSWLVILALLTWTLINVFQATIPDLPLADSWAMGMIAAFAFFACIILHELGHAVVARATGIPVRGITLFLFGGVAELEREPTSAKGEFLMALAGPLVSALLAGAAWLLASTGEAAGWVPQVVAILEYLVWINTLVLVFNMIPAFPLDGGRVFRSIVWGTSGNLGRATYWAALLGQGFAWWLIIVGVANFFAGQIFHGLWLGLIGLFLKDAAQASYQQVLVRQILRGEPVARFMTADPVAVPPSLGLRQWVEDYVYRHHLKAFPVMADGHLEGFVSTKALTGVPRETWDFRTVGDVMRHDWPAVSIAPEADALDALAKMESTGSSRLLVVQGDQLVGIVSLKDLLRFLQLKIELEGEDGRPHGEANGGRDWHERPGRPLTHCSNTLSARV